MGGNFPAGNGRDEIDGKDPRFLVPEDVPGERPKAVGTRRNAKIFVRY